VHPRDSLLSLSSVNSLRRYDETVEERRHRVLGRSLIFLSPVVAAFWGMALRELAIAGFVSVDPEWFIVLNAVIAVFGSSAGVCLLHGRLLVKILGSLAYGVLSLFIYGILIAYYFDLRY
jgi:hypothetical protein